MVMGMLINLPIKQKKMGKVTINPSIHVQTKFMETKDVIW
jgi:hypothetical protein